VKSTSGSAFERKKELDERIAKTKDKMNFSQVSIDYDAETMCNLCHASSVIDLGVLSCCKKALIHKKCWEGEIKQQGSRKKVVSEV
jgi:predicted transcriptional regulator